MPVALRAVRAEDEEVVGPLLSSSSWERSRPRVFLTACFEFLGAVVFVEDSSAARRASFSAFLRAASCFFKSASSLEITLAD